MAEFKHKEKLDEIIANMPGWRVKKLELDATYQWASIEFPEVENAELNIHFGRWRHEDRVFVRPIYPRTCIGETTSPSFFINAKALQEIGGAPEDEISVAMTRVGSAIARDIERRLLGQYFIVMVRINEENRLRTERWRANCEIAQHYANMIKDMRYEPNNRSRSRSCRFLPVTGYR